jgi:rhodanese-related sulfurtransferase
MVKVMTAAVVMAATTGLIVLSGCDEIRVSDSDVKVLREYEVIEAMKAPGTVLVDVRKPETYRAGHIEGAINLFLPQIVAGDPLLADSKRIIVYAGGWTDPLSTAAAKRMLALGYVNVEEFKGGVEVWTEMGHKLVTTPEPPPAAIVRPEAGQ